MLTHISIGGISWHDGQTVAHRVSGAIYHVLSRGDRREAIFRSDTDRKLFLDLLGQTCRQTGGQIHPVIE